MQHWYALHTKPRQEQQVSQILAGKGLETYLPTLAVTRVRRGHRARMTQPLFPCYLFARFDLDAVGISAVQWTPGLRNLVAFGGEPAVVDERVIALIQTRLAEGRVSATLDRCKFRAGDRVRITAGPFSDLHAVFDRPMSGALRAKILIRVLGRLVNAEVDMDSLEKASPLNRSARLTPGLKPL